MKMMTKESDNDRLILYQRSMSFIGVPLTLICLLVMVGNSVELLKGIGDREGLSAGLFFAFCFFIAGLDLLRSRRFVFDRSKQQIIETRKWLFFKRVQELPFESVQAVVCRLISANGEGTDPYRILLKTADEEIVLVEVFNIEEAEATGNMLVKFLGLVELVSDHPPAPDPVIPESVEELRKQQAERISFLHSIGEAANLKTNISTKTGQLMIYKKPYGFNGFFINLLRLFLLISSVFFLLSNIFIRIQPKIPGDDLKEMLLPSLGMIPPSLFLLYFKRGMLFDRNTKSFVHFWGSPWLVLRRHNLTGYMAVVYLEDVSATAIVGRTIFMGEGLPDIPLQNSAILELDKLRAIGRQVADFIGLPMIEHIQQS